MKKIIYTDIHRFSAKKIKTKIFYENNAVFLNDIWDVHCLKKNAKTVKKLIKVHAEKCKETPSIINVKSNHGGIYEKDLPLFIIENNVLYTHGHFNYSEKEMKKWESKIAGISKCKFYGIKVSNFFRKLKGQKMNKKALIKLAEFAEKYNCHTIVCGHYHKKHDGYVGMTRVIVCNCGRTKIEV